MARRGIAASMGITATSWNNSTEKALWPASVFIRPFSFNVWSTIAVDESAADPMRAIAEKYPEITYGETPFFTEEDMNLIKELQQLIWLE